MPAFTLEIFRQGEPPVIASVLTLSDPRAIWCHVEALALRIGENEGAFIRVKDNKGQTVIRAGVATAVASIEKCSYGACPLKEELKRRGSFGNREVAELGAHFPPCERRAGKP
jgi:hypothetical protein